MAAAMMMEMPIKTAPMTMPSAVFWSSSISLRIENGVALPSIPKASAKNIKTDKHKYQRRHNRFQKRV